ncbi:hypothetical protein ACLB2K_022171 [Fragaria x ananassa]
MKCCNHSGFTVAVIKGHVYFNGIMINYKNWDCHGEAAAMEGDSGGESESVDKPDDIEGEENKGEEDEEMSFDSDEFLRLVEDGDKALYPRCTKSTKLNTLVEMFNLKAKHGMTDGCIFDWLMLFESFLPDGNEVPCNIAEVCPTCTTLRYKIGKNGVVRDGVAAKVLWYFPIIPRLKRMFQSPRTAKSLTWHGDRKKDGMMRHPADSPTWKLVDTQWPEFGKEPKNLRLTLLSNGFNPYVALSSKYSCWPVILVTYNLPPWLCMKRKFMMLYLLISGPKQPRKDIDVYLQPLIDDLKLLWQGVEGVLPKVDGKKSISPARFFSRPSSAVKPPETATLVPKASSSSLLHCWIGGVSSNAAVRDKSSSKTLAVRIRYQSNFSFLRSPFVRHMLDVMPIEKNCCDAIIGTLLNILGKTKDGAACRLDMVDMGIKTDLKVVAGEKKAKLPLASWNLLHHEKKIVCRSFFGMSVPTRFSSNISNLVSMEDLKLVGLKSHDCHTVMQYLLPIALRSVLEKPVRYAIIRFCLFFKAICSKVINVSRLKQMQADLVDTVCLLEKFFPPSFFDIMIHLTVHLVREVEWCGPVFFRWMFPFGRYMKVLKGYVKNRHFPEGCMSEKYIVEEAVEYLEVRIHSEGGITVGIPSTSKAGNYKQSRPLSRPTIISVYGKQMHLAHLCVLQNTEDVQPYIKEHNEYLELNYPNNVKNKKWMREKHNATFPD